MTVRPGGVCHENSSKTGALGPNGAADGYEKPMSAKLSVLTRSPPNAIASVPPVDPALTQFSPCWQGVTDGRQRVDNAIQPLNGCQSNKHWHVTDDQLSA
jgi:hypothetical protein